MYNITLVNIAGGSYIPPNGLTSSDAPFLTVQKANPIYVNQAGDYMNGDLDMKNNKILNVLDPSDSSHVINKRYLDNTLRMTLSSMDNIIEQKLVEHKNEYDLLMKVKVDKSELDKELIKVKNNVDVSTDQKLIQHKNEYDLLMKVKVDKSELDKELIKVKNNADISTDQKLTKHKNEYDLLLTNKADKTIIKELTDNLKGSFKNFKKSFDSKIHTYYFHLDIGESQNSYYKISEYILPISNLKELALKLNLPAIKPSQCIFQITPILDNEKYHDQVFMNIRDFHITA